MQTLFPEIKPYAEHALAVSDIHTLHVEECGSPDGIPVLVVHGGPGAGCDAAQRRFFDPEKYRVVLFDQRGAGRSTPHAELTDNNLKFLIQDIEHIRETLGVKQWLLFGGSWGSTLSLAYAQAYPERVAAMILRGIFLCRDQDIHWLYQEGASRIFPDYWKGFLEAIPKDQHGDLLTAYHKAITGGNELARMSAAKAWCKWEGSCSTLKPNPALVDHFVDPHFALSMASMCVHYFVNRGFLKQNQLLDDCSRIQEIPTIIIHGRYDMVCCADNAQALHDALPLSRLHMIREAGHSTKDPALADALVKATEEIFTELTN
jgi:proline iminopeptidase